VAYRVILFDLDGTLIDSIALILASFHHARRVHFGDRLPDSHYLATLGTTLRDVFTRMADTPEKAEALVSSYIDHNLKAHDSMVRPYPGIPETIRELRRRGARLGIVTSKLREHALRGLSVARMAGDFEVVVGAEDVSRGKPDPAPVLLALERFGVPAPDALFVGDSPHDLESGRRAGVKTAAATWGPFARDALEAAHPDFWLETPADVLSVSGLEA
jgi:pyrophosphatase PpaX